MHHKTDAIKQFKQIMDTAESNQVQKDSLFASVLTTLQYLTNNMRYGTVEQSLMQRALNYAEHIFSLINNSLESRTEMREEVKAVAAKMIQIRASRKASQKLPEEFHILLLRLETLVASLDYSGKRAAIVELLRAEPSGKLALFDFVKKYSSELREAYPYVNM